MRRRLRCAPAVLLLAAACEAPTPPTGEVQLRVVSHVEEVRLLAPVDGGSHPVRCDVVYEQLPGTRAVQWRDASFQFHFGAARTNIDELVFVDGEALERSWETLELGGRTILGSRWEFVSPVPFSLTAEMAYTQEGEAATRVVRPRVSCGPEPSATDSLPRITGAVAPLAGLRRGSELRVGYTAHSSLGLWEVAIHVTGAWETVVRMPEDFRRSGAREVVLTVPPFARLGEPVSVAVSAVDAALRTAFVSFTTAAIE